MLHSTVESMFSLKNKLWYKMSHMGPCPHISNPKMAEEAGLHHWLKVMLMYIYSAKPSGCFIFNISPEHFQRLRLVGSKISRFTELPGLKRDLMFSLRSISLHQLARKASNKDSTVESKFITAHLENGFTLTPVGKGGALYKKTEYEK